ncbi:MAG: UvrB/UvrC motif-containing protein, partial [Candidatus Omnitrophota bacterium]
DFPVVWVARKTTALFKADPRAGKQRIMGKAGKRAGKEPADSVFYCHGPYTDVKLLKQAMKSIRRIFSFRSCRKMPKRPCLYYRLALCPAPCAGKITVREYRQIIKNIMLFLEGRQDDLIGKLTLKMRKLSDDKKFEDAALIRNQIQALSSISPKRLGGAEKGIRGIKEPYRESLDLKQSLGLSIRPQRIEAFDVSNISGSSACASMVSFHKGMPDKNNYRRFRIKGVSGIDDYRMLKEAVARRYRRVIREGLPLADLIIVDGGKGQINAVKKQLQELNLNLAVIGIAKRRRAYGRLRAKTKDEIFVFNRRMPVNLKSGSRTLFLIQRIRDEAHRFALAYHHILRRKKTLGKPR